MLYMRMIKMVIAMLPQATANISNSDSAVCYG